MEPNFGVLATLIPVFLLATYLSTDYAHPTPTRLTQFADRWGILAALGAELAVTLNLVVLMPPGYRSITAVAAWLAIASLSWRLVQLSFARTALPEQRDAGQQIDHEEKQAQRDNEEPPRPAHEGS